MKDEWPWPPLPKKEKKEKKEKKGKKMKEKKNVIETNPKPLPKLRDPFLDDERPDDLNDDELDDLFDYINRGNGSLGETT